MKREEIAALCVDDAAVDKIMAFYGRDVQKYKAQMSEWGEKYAADTAALQTQLTNLQTETALEQAVSGMRFSSQSAKQAFSAALKAQQLTLENGKFAQLDAFVEQYRADDPAAFLQEAAPKTPVLVLPTGNTSAATPPDAALRAAFGLNT